MTILESAKAADARARDMIAISVDRHLSRAPLVRGMAAKLLTRPASREGGTSATILAQEVGRDERALFDAIARAGAASIAELRRRMTVVRLASIFSDESVSWEVAAEAMGAADSRPLIRSATRDLGESAREWRSRVRLSREFNDFEAFLHENAPKWSKVRLHRVECPHCQRAFIAEAA